MRVKSERAKTERVTYPDGSSVEELENGAMLIREGNPAPVEGLEVQQAPYDQPAPAPKWKAGFRPKKADVN